MGLKLYLANLHITLDARSCFRDLAERIDSIWEVDAVCPYPPLSVIRLSLTTGDFFEPLEDCWTAAYIQPMAFACQSKIAELPRGQVFSNKE